MSRVIPREQVWQLLRARARRLVRAAKRAGYGHEVVCTAPTNDITPQCGHYAVAIGLNDALYCAEHIPQNVEHIWRFR